MKRLILIQNDYPGAGKSTLAECLHHYLQTYRVAHHVVSLVEAADDSCPNDQIEAASFQLPGLIAHLERSELVVLDVASGLGEMFNTFYKKHELDHVLSELGFEMTVLVPVTGERESFDGVTMAAEDFSDSSQYLIVHSPTGSSYDEDDHTWERSYAARVMDMFEAADLDMPPFHDALESRLNAAHKDMADVMRHPSSDTELQAEVSKWFRRVAAQLDSVRKYVFGDAFRPAIAMAPPPKRRAPRTRAKVDGAVA
jgi:hypothetical protein